MTESHKPAGPLFEGFAIRQMCPSDLAAVRSALAPEANDCFYAITKPQMLEELEAHIRAESAFNFVAEVEGKLVGAVLGGVTLRGALHHLWAEDNTRRLDIGEQLVRRYLRALATEGGVRRTNLVCPVNSWMDGIWPRINHVLPPGEGLAFVNLSDEIYRSPKTALPTGYEVRMMRAEDDVFGLWCDAKDHVAESVFTWEKPLTSQMLSSGGSTVATYEGHLIGAVCAIRSWRTASLNHLKVVPEHRHQGLWNRMLEMSFAGLKANGALCAHGSVECPRAFTRKTAFRYDPQHWSFVQADLTSFGEPV